MAHLSIDVVHDRQVRVGVQVGANRTPDRGGVEVQMEVFGASDDVKALASFRDAGVERVLHLLPAAGADKVFPVLDAYAKVTY